MEEVFCKRPGTTDKGNDYAILNIANIIIDLVTHQQIIDFQISSNDEDFAFDDIVVETQVAESTEKIAVQLNHNDRGNLSLKQLTQAKGNFSIKKYFASWQTLKVDNTKFILYTDLKLNFTNNIKFYLVDENFPITLTRVHPSDAFKISQTNHYCYKFSIVDDNSFATSDKVSLYQQFFENFYLYTDQENLTDIKQRVTENFKTSFCGNSLECDQFVKFLNGWGLLKRKEKLNKKWMKLVIALNIFSSRIKSVCFNDFQDTKSVNRNILREAIEAFNITIFGKESYDGVKELWGDLKSKIDLDTFNKLIIKYQLAPSYISDVDELDSITLNVLLWLTGKCPLILTSDESVHKNLDLCVGQKYILLEDNSGNSFAKNIAAFRTLSDLKIKEREYDQLVKNFKCSLQGKQEISLETLVEVDQVILTLLKTDDILQMVKDQFNIGKVQEYLEEPYIERCLFKNAIDVEVLNSIIKDSCVIVDCVSKKNKLRQRLDTGRYNITNIEDYFNGGIEVSKYFSPSKATFCLSEKQCQYREFNVVSNKTKNLQPRLQHLHQFRLRSDENLEWIKSQGDVSGLEKYKLSEYYPVQERDLSSPEFHNNVNLLISGPGAGKSELIKSFKIKCFPEWFTININPTDVNFFSKNTKDGDFVNAFKKFLLNEKCKMLSVRDKSIFSIFLEKNKVVLVWDGMDELSEQHKTIVCDNILKLPNFSHWVTSRHHLQTMLQQKLNVLPLHLIKFNEQEQRNYIQKRLNELNPVGNIDTILEKIKSNFLSLEQENILGIPLQLFMLTELLRRNEKKYSALLDKLFTLSDLYKYFLDEKMNILYKEKLGLDLDAASPELLVQNQKEKLLEEHTNAALRLLFTDEILIQCQQSSKMKHLEVVTEVIDQIPRLIRNSFAEYLAACYFESKIKQKQLGGEQSTSEDTNLLLQIMFDPKYVNVRFFFDLLLAGDSKGHVSVINKDFSFIKDCRDDRILTRTDSIGRSVLHLACSWGPSSRQLDVERFGNAYIVDDWVPHKSFAKDSYYLEATDRLIETCDIVKCEEIFKMTPEEYARKTQCLVAEMKIIMKQDTVESIKIDQIINILYLSARFGFHEEFVFFFDTFQRICGKLKNCRRKFDNIKDKFGNTLFHIAAIMGHVKILEFFCRAGADVNLKRRDDVTPVHAASMSGHYESVEFLAKVGADVNLPDKTGTTPVNSASRNGHFEIVEYLVNVGTDFNHADEDGDTPLHSACSRGFYHIVKLLVRKGADYNLKNKYGTTPLYLAVQNQHFEIFKYLVDDGDVNLTEEQGDTLLHLTSSKGYYEFVEFLIEKGARFNLANYYDGTPLNSASRNGHFKVVEYLVNVGTDVNLANENGNTPLHSASSGGFYDIVKFLVEKGASFNLANYSKGTPLNSASRNGHFKIVQYLVSVGTDVNLANICGDTPLHSASSKGFYDIVKFLVKKGACCNLLANYSGTPLNSASQNGHLEIVNYLVSAGSDINLGDEDSCTPLHTATISKYYDIVKFLSENGASVNLVNKYGCTPLHLASHQGLYDIAKFLVERGAEINRSDYSGSTPLDVASDIKHYQVVEYLIQQGAVTKLEKKKKKKKF